MKFLFIFISILFSLSLIHAQCYNLVWADEFNSGSVDNTKWSYQTGAGGWGNNELQYYTDRVDNSLVSGGSLKIIAKNESYMGSSYTSSRMRTINNGDWTYGKMEASIKLPQGQGIWPAFWMMPTNSEYGGWPSSGEIDIMEFLGHQTSVIHGTCHYGNSSVDKSQTGGSNNISPASYADGAYHVFSIEWEPSQIRWYVDGYQYITFNAGDESPYTFPFNKDFHFILNIAVGGNWPGSPDGTTIFPQTMEIDYVRVYQLLEDIKISGLKTVEPYQIGTIYSVPDISGTTYSWTLPSDATIVSGDNTNEITVNWTSTGGDIQVDMTNNCGNESLFLTVDVTANQVNNPGFENNFSNWFTDVFSPASASWNISTTDVYAGSKSMCANVSSLGTAAWNIQISPENVDLVDGEDYTIQVWAKADINTRVMSVAIINSTTFDYYGGTTFNLTDQWALYSYSFTSPVTANSSINIQFGHELGTFCIDDFLFARTIALPITLINFRGKVFENDILLEWETTHEQNFSHFNIERSINGIDFKQVGVVQGKNRAGTVVYSFLDPTINTPPYYYRLKQIDYDQGYSYSKVILIENPLSQQLEIHPTVVNSIAIVNNLNKNTALYIYNIGGQLIQAIDTKNAYKLSINVSNLDTGIYLIKSGQEILRFFKL